MLELNGRFAIGVPCMAMQRIAAGVAAAMSLSVVLQVSRVVSRPFLPRPIGVAGVITDHEFTIALGNGTAAAALGILRLFNI